MSKICQITGKKAMIGNNVSHSKRRTKRTFDLNLFNKKFYYVEQDCWISLSLCANGLRIINKKGLDAALNDAVAKGFCDWKSIKVIGLNVEGENLQWQKKAKGNRVQVILECTEHKESGMPGTSRYITTKNRKNTTERLELKKYNPILKRVTVHKEIK